MSKQELYKNKDWLEEEYLEKEKNAPDVGKEFGVTRDTIYYWLEKFNISVRNPGPNIKKKNKLHDQNWLKRKYLEEGLSTLKIAESINCSSKTIRKYLHKFNIPVRGVEGISHKQPYRDKKWLRKKFNKESLNIDEIAQQADSSDEVILKYLHKFNILDTTKGWKKIECDYCGRQFQRRVGNINNSHNFCSAECSRKFQTERRTVKCDQCGKEVERLPSEIKNNKHFFCSKECQGKWLSENWSGEDHPRYKKITIKCKQCGKSLEVIPSREKEAERVFCSRECQGKWRAENWTGSEHPRWNGGSSNYYGPNWQNQRERALERDNHTCQRCGKEKKLEVHHIVPFSRFRYPLFRENPVRNVLAEFDWKRANRTENLISLCLSCHKKVEGNEDFFN